MASLALIVSGCTAAPVVVEMPPRPRPEPPPTVPSPPPAVDVAGGGRIVMKPGRAGHVVAAPHGDSDLHTADIAAEIAERTGFALVAATGFWVEPRGTTGPRRRYHVNRPLEGVPGRPSPEEVATPAARDVYLTYERSVREAAQGPLAFYVEIHGNGRPESAGRVEIATVGMGSELAARLRTLFELIRDAHLRGRPSAPRLDVLVDPADTIHFLATATRRHGLLGQASRAVHVELPLAARTVGRDAYAAIVADFLVQAAALPAGR